MKKEGVKRPKHPKPKNYPDYLQDEVKKGRMTKKEKTEMLKNFNSKVMKKYC